MSNRNHDPNLPNAGEPDPVERAAAEWVLRREHGMHGDDQSAFRRWLNQDPRHARVFAEMEETSRLLDHMRIDAPRGASPMAQATSAQRRPVSYVPYLRAALAVAAVVAVVFFGWRKLTPAAPTFVESAATQVGGLRELDLPDGSVVLLNTSTAIKVSYLESERRVELLRGEAYFTVAKDPSRPFWVQAGQVAIRAVGTAFNVRLTPTAVNVLVTEGKVRVAQVNGDDIPSSPSKQAVDLGSILTVGHIAQVLLGANHVPSPASMIITSIESRTANSALAWREGRLEFFDTPLSEVVSEFNRYNQHKIVIADPVLASRRFGGAFASHRIEPLLELLQQSFGVVSENRGNETVIRLAK
jgi:transmembrane sensor